MKLRVAFFGSPAFAVPTLESVAATENVVLVTTQPDKPSGRGRRLEGPAVKAAAERLGLPVWQPSSIKVAEAHERLRALAPDVGVVVAYGKILPQTFLDIPKYGFLNVHASLLPKYRGAAPIQWALIRGESETGVTIMQLDAGMDTGPMLLKQATPISETDTSGSLHDRLSASGAALMVQALQRLRRGDLRAEPQDHTQATTAPLLKKEDGLVDFRADASTVSARVRGVDPWPGAFTFLGDEPLKLFRPTVTAGRGVPGQVLAIDRHGLTVACAGGAVTFAELQLPGRSRMAAQALVAGRSIALGTQLGRP